MAVKLGIRVRDNITGLTGIAVARTEWLHGCARVTIQPEELKDGKPVESYTVDEQQVELVKTEKRRVSPLSSATAGGPQPTPARHGDPRR